MQGLHTGCLCLHNESLDMRLLKSLRVEMSYRAGQLKQDNSLTMLYAMAGAMLQLLSSRVERTCTSMHGFRDSTTVIVSAAGMN